MTARTSSVARQDRRGRYWCERGLTARGQARRQVRPCWPASPAGQADTGCRPADKPGEPGTSPQSHKFTYRYIHVCQTQTAFFYTLAVTDTQTVRLCQRHPHMRSESLNFPSVRPSMHLSTSRQAWPGRGAEGLAGRPPLATSSGQLQLTQSSVKSLFTRTCVLPITLQRAAIVRAEAESIAAGIIG
ncbi:hypothetical protein ElyMa_000825200 [Elysia marginata]|uniref:Uncharacterized protein n=1 Tax=Elysia marginata TaxID=1093978 RepID=A0AAV4GXR0_9GAST|nr:hypothetical protein ElyMa_000825200 [Elysia marginata]